MPSLQAALEQVQKIEAAVAAGEFERANVAAQQLKPLLVSEQIEELQALRSRIDELTIGVREHQTQSAVRIKDLRLKRGGTATYQQIQQDR